MNDSLIFGIFDVPVEAFGTGGFAALDLKESAICDDVMPVDCGTCCGS